MCDPAYCDKIEKSDIVLDLVTNGRVKHCGMKCELDNPGEAWFNKNSLTNIFILADLVNKFKIKYDSKIEDAFLVYAENKKVKFNILANRIYEMCPVTTDDKQKQLLQMKIINTVDENNFFSPNVKYGVPKYYSPRLIVCQENVDYENHLKIIFGTYVLAKNEPKPTNTNALRHLD